MDQKPEEDPKFDFDVLCFYVDPKVDPAEQVAHACVLAYHSGKRKCAWVTFAGYDEDPREVWDIPECKEWTRSFLSTLFVASLRDGVSYASILGDDRTAQGPGFGLPNLLGLGWGKTVKGSEGMFKIMVREEDYEKIKEAFDAHN